MRRIVTTKFQNFLNNYSVDHQTKCWEWTGNFKIRESGYKMCFFSYRQERHIIAKNFSFEYYIGEIPEDYFVTNGCGNSICVNPSHLTLIKKSLLSEKGRKNNASKVKLSDTCPRGHLREKFGIKMVNGKRRCPECLRIADRKFKDKKRNKITQQTH